MDCSVYDFFFQYFSHDFRYEVFLMPFYKKLEGQPSNSLHIQTLEDVPSAPPTNIRAEMINKTSAGLSWAPPPPQHRNGILKGYQIHVKGNGSAFHSNITLNATTTNFVLTNLSLNEEYSVRAVAFTTIGLGPFSPPTHFMMDPAYLKFSVVPTGKIYILFSLQKKYFLTVFNPSAYLFRFL